MLQKEKPSETTIPVIKSADDLKVFLAKNYLAQIKNFFGDERRAMKFMSSVMAAVQKNPKLLGCTPTSLINSFITMAQLGLMPSDVSGEAYVLPYRINDQMVAQFQMGYQGFITLFYRAGVQTVRADVVRKKDVFTLKNGIVSHEIDPSKSNEERGEAIGAYAIGIVNGHEIAKYMNKKDIMNMGAKFSKSYGTAFTPWKEKQDPELWMWKKTVIKQLGKLLPKNDSIFEAISIDNEVDGKLPKVEGLVDGSNLNMGSFLKENGHEKPKITQVEAAQAPTADGNQQ